MLKSATMEILLPKRNDSAQTEKLLSRTVTVVGANGAGKSRFGVEIARRIQDHAFWLSAQKALCIMPPHEVWPGSIEAMYQEFLLCIEGYPYRIRPVAFLAVERGVPQSVRV